MTEIPLAPMDKILRNAGAKRVSKKAAKAFAEVLENISSDLSKEAILLAKHSGRKTIHAIDIQLAKRIL